ncbi:MAG: 2-oxoacid:acceptor oxidoreductase family protein [Caldiserica bacterium]|nr:2-oxoacid:acceptor oxidoreductase family protein [Caldisericota bacterium]
MDISITISGEAGQGVKTLGSLTARILFDRGYYVVQDESYHSRIRGGLDATTIRHGPVRSAGLVRPPLPPCRQWP